jgi:hypothetical protein
MANPEALKAAMKQLIGRSFPSQLGNNTRSGSLTISPKAQRQIERIKKQNG